MWLSLVTTNDYYHAAVYMQPSDTQLTGVPQQIIIDPNTGLPQDVIIIQQPSSGPKIIGIFIIIFGAINILGEVGRLGDNISLGGLFLISSAVNVIVGGGYIVGGYMIQAYQQRGVHLSLLMLVISTIVGVLTLTMMPDLIEDVAEDEGLSDDEREQLEANSGLIAGVGAIFLVICNGICGLIIAIPMMISNNGLDDSSLFGGWF
tara:strand:+ start:252 stop:866 length:615 start_codon:yes stop_codon:yes gene_type:complete